MTLENLLENYKSYEAKPDVELVKRAYNFAEAAHVGETRLGGFEFIKHPLAVALLLADIHSDGETLASGLLHDVLEHTNLSKEDLTTEFSETIANLVDGVSVIQRVSQTVGSEKGTEENLQKLLLATAKDPRVLLIRMAEEVDNLQNLDTFPKVEQEITLAKAFEIYSPLADLLGVHVFKNRLEDLAFQRTNPEEFAEISQKIDEIAEQRGKCISDLGEQLKDVLAKEGVEARVEGRKKHVYGVYRKLPQYAERGKGIWYDVVGLRIVTDKTEQCYQALDVVHKIGKPEQDLYNDYIAHPKPNNYQSLHTIIWVDSAGGEQGRTIPAEIQIRTKEMHKVAEFGLAAHAYYKEKEKSLIAPEEKVRLLRSLIGWEKGKELNLFADEVFVFTPKVDVVDLPKGATPVDFAFAVHTDLGKGCAGAKVNGKMVSLDYQLQNGEMVEIVTARGKEPSADWLKFVKTDLARSQIKRALKET